MSIPKPGSERFKTAALLLLMMAGVTALSVFFFLNQSLRLDEAQSLWQTSRGPLAIMQYLLGDVHVPLYHLILHYWRILFGDTLIVSRLMSLFFLLLSVPAMYALGKVSYNRNVGLFGALLISISPFIAWYGSEIRMYTLFMFLVILNQYFYVRIFKKKSELAWWGYGITALLGIYSHYFFFLNLASQALFYFWRHPIFPLGSLKRFLIVAALVVITFFPWAYSVYQKAEIENQSPLLATPTSINFFNTLSQFVFGFQDTHINTIFLSLWPVALIFGFFSLRKGKETSPVTEYFFITVAVSMILAFTISFTIVPVFVSRYLIFTIPSLYLLIVSHLNVYPPRYARVFKVTVILVMLVTLFVEIRSTATPVKENYREAVEYLNENVKPQDVLVVSAPFTVYPIEYYYRGVAPIETLPAWDRYSFGPIPPFSAEELPAQVDALAKDHQELWLLLSYDQGYESEIKLYFDTHYQRVFEGQFSPGLNLYRYKLRYDTELSKLSE